MSKNLSILSTINNLQSQYRKFQKLISEELSVLGIRLTSDDILILINIYDYVLENNKAPTLSGITQLYNYSKIHINYSLKNLDNQKFIKVTLSNDPEIELSDKGQKIINQIHSSALYYRLISIMEGLENNIKTYISTK